MEVRVTGPLARDEMLKQQAAQKIRDEAEAQGYDTSEFSDAELLEMGLGDLWKKAKKKAGQAVDKVGDALGSVKKKVGGLFEEKTTIKTEVYEQGSGKKTTSVEVTKGGKTTKFDEKEHPRGPDGKFAKSADEKSKKTESKGKVIEPVKTSKMDCKGGNCTATLPSGHTVKFEDKNNKLDVEAKRQIADALGDLRSIYPNLKIDKIKVGGVSKKHAAQVKFTKSNQIEINDETEGFQAWRKMTGGYHQDSDEKKNFPYSNGAQNAKAIIFHEAGHSFDAQKNVMSPKNPTDKVINTISRGLHIGGGTTKLYNDKKLKPYLGKYGNTNTFEAYAEMFSEWHLSGGKSKNPAVLAYAKHEKWRGSDGSAFSAGASYVGASTFEFAADDEPVEEDGLIIHDTFDPDNPPTVTGDYVVDDLSPEEDAEIDALIRSVFEELGLPYEE